MWAGLPNGLACPNLRPRMRSLALVRSLPTRCWSAHRQRGSAELHALIRYANLYGPLLPNWLASLGPLHRLWLIFAARSGSLHPTFPPLPSVLR